MYFMKPWMIGCLVVPMGTIKPPLFSLWCWCFHQGINQEAEAMPLSFTQWKRQSTTICSVLGKQTFKFHSLYSMVIRNSFPSALWSFFFFLIIFSHMLFCSLPYNSTSTFAIMLQLWPWMTVTNLGPRSTIYADFLSNTLSLLLNSVFFSLNFHLGYRWSAIYNSLMYIAT